MANQVSVAILAAGLGTRMKSKKAKVLHEAGGRTLVEHVTLSALAIAPPEGIAVVVGHQAEQVRLALASYGVGFALQAEQRGTGHALLMCRESLEARGGRVVILYGDCPLLSRTTLQELLRRHAAGGATATVITTTLADPTGYGRIVRGAGGEVAAIVEQKAATAEQRAIREINSGIYCFEAAHLWPALAALPPNPASGEIYLTDIVESIHRTGGRVEAFVIEDSTELLGINTRVELAEADRLLRGRKAVELMLDGVTIEKPESVSIDAGVRIGRDTVIEPFTRLLGETAIGEDCRIGMASIVRDSVIGDRVAIGPYSYIAGSHLEQDSEAGPYARLRQGSRVEAGARVGNFVELKNTNLGEGSKAMHLAYLGDSTVGARVNIGAGTITCNYDGVNKHRTRIGDAAFIGSNATLVAPVEVGNGSYVAAGSVITEPVEEDTLALGRARQVAKPGWPSRRKARK